MTTVAYVVLDLEAGRLIAVSAGHVPPLLAPAEGEPQMLPVVGDPPLGVSPATRYREHEFDLPSGSTVLLVTDGAIEVRGEVLDRGLERLRRAARDERDLDALCELITRGDLRPEPAQDDVAALAARIRPLPERLSTRWAARPDAFGGLRPLLRRWLGRWGATADEVYDITVAVQEAAANAVEHAYAPGDGAFEVDADHEDGLVTVVVRDRGHWRPPRGRHRGRGLPMMQALMEDVDVRHSDNGTTVVLRRRLKGSAA
jgi:anti-sigma regulatory factor (Ser/Thr protein kinase)